MEFLTTRVTKDHIILRSLSEPLTLKGENYLHNIDCIVSKEDEKKKGREGNRGRKERKGAAMQFCLKSCNFSIG